MISRKTKCKAAQPSQWAGSMDPDEASVPRAAAAPGDRLERLSASARGWHTIQMAVLGFIGICGILRAASSPGSARSPMAGRCAGGRRAGGRMHGGLHRRPGRLPLSVTPLMATALRAGGTARLRAGIRLTIVALILAVIASAIWLVAIAC